MKIRHISTVSTTGDSTETEELLPETQNIRLSSNSLQKITEYKDDDNTFDDDDKPSVIKTETNRHKLDEGKDQFHDDCQDVSDNGIDVGFNDTDKETTNYGWAGSMLNFPSNTMMSSNIEATKIHHSCFKNPSKKKGKGNIFFAESLTEEIPDSFDILQDDIQASGLNANLYPEILSETCTDEHFNNGIREEATLINEHFKNGTREEATLINNGYLESDI